MVIRESVFYRTPERIQKGDFFYQIVLDCERDFPSDGPIRVAVFYGRVGSPIQSLWTESYFITAKAAENEFDRMVINITAQGFSRHSPLSRLKRKLRPV